METILVVEGVPKHADIMRTHLEKQNFKVLVGVSSGKPWLLPG